jgi:hypothetical protein
MKKLEVLHQTLKYMRGTYSLIWKDIISSFNQLLMVYWHFSSYIKRILKFDRTIFLSLFFLCLFLFTEFKVLFKMSSLLRRDRWLIFLALKCKSTWIIHAGFNQQSIIFIFCRKCTVDMINWVQYKLLYMVNSEGMCSCVKLLWLTTFVLSTSWFSRRHM